MSYIPGSGGFSYQTTDASSNPTIGTNLPEISVVPFEISHSVQVQIPAAVFNAKLGLLKTLGSVVDPSFGTRPQYTLDPSVQFTQIYDFSNNQWIQDSITLNASEFVAGIGSAAGITNTGLLRTAYAEFGAYIESYFQLSGGSSGTGISGGFGTLLDVPLSECPTPDSVLDSATLWEMLHSPGPSIPTSSYTDPQVLTKNPYYAYTKTNILDGSIQISDLTQSLRFAVEYNPFGNRSRLGGLGPGLALDPSNSLNYSVLDGFFPNDLICIPVNGLTIHFHLNINTHSTVQNQLANMMGINPNPNLWTYDLSFADLEFLTTCFQSQTTQTKTYLGRMISCPLLIRLT